MSIGRVAPAHVYSAIVTNKAASVARVVATYAMPDGSQKRLTVEVPPGGRGELAQQIVTQGSVSSTGRIVSVVATLVGTGKSSELRERFNVNSPTKGFPLIIGEDGSLQQNP